MAPSPPSKRPRLSLSPSPSPPPKRRIKQEPSPTAPDNTEQAEEDDCAICLQPIQDRTVLPACAHDAFCFECILIWTEQSRKCPLCIHIIGDHLIHNIRSPYDYQKHFLPPLPSGSPSRPISAQQRRQIQSRRTREWGRRRNREREAEDELERAVDRRRWVYRHDLYAKHVASNPYTRYKPAPTPSQFATSSDLLSRATAFLRRELLIWPNLDVEFLTTFILSLLKSLDIRSEASVKLLAEFLDMSEGGQKNAEHFAHEVYSYLRSPYRSLTIYDTIVQYDSPSGVSPISGTAGAPDQRWPLPLRSPSPDPHRRDNGRKASPRRMSSWSSRAVLRSPDRSWRNNDARYATRPVQMDSHSSNAKHAWQASRRPDVSRSRSVSPLPHPGKRGNERWEDRRRTPGSRSPSVPAQGSVNKDALRGPGYRGNGHHGNPPSDVSPAANLVVEARRRDSSPPFGGRSSGKQTLVVRNDRSLDHAENESLTNAGPSPSSYSNLNVPLASNADDVVNVKSETLHGPVKLVRKRMAPLATIHAHILSNHPTTSMERNGNNPLPRTTAASGLRIKSAASALEEGTIVASQSTGAGATLIIPAASASGLRIKNAAKAVPEESPVSINNNSGRESTSSEKRDGVSYGTTSAPSVISTPTIRRPSAAIMADARARLAKELILAQASTLIPVRGESRDTRGQIPAPTASPNDGAPARNGNQPSPGGSAPHNVTATTDSTKAHQVLKDLLLSKLESERALLLESERSERGSEVKKPAGTGASSEDRESRLRAQARAQVKLAAEKRMLL